MENKPKTRLVKGSEEAKSHMANLRSKRGANKPPVEVTTPPPTQPTQPIEIPTQPKPKSRKNLNVDFP